MPTSADELAGLVATAQRATAELDDPALQRVAFEQVLEHLLTGGDSVTSTGPTRQLTTPSAVPTSIEGADGAFASEQQRVDALAHYFKIDPDNVRHVFDVSSQEPQLVLPTSRIADSKTEGAREITLLVAGARTALGQQTSTSDIREAADHFGKLDVGNFMASLAKMVEVSVLGKPRSPNRVVRMRATGAEAAQALAQRITSE